MGRTLIHRRWNLVQVRPQRPVQGMVVHHPRDSRTLLVNGEVQRNTRWDGPITLHDSALDVNANYLAGEKLIPREKPRVAQKRAVSEVVRDMSCQMIRVPLDPQRTSEQRQLLALR